MHCFQRIRRVAAAAISLAAGQMSVGADPDAASAARLADSECHALTHQGDAERYQLAIYALS